MLNIICKNTQKFKQCNYLFLSCLSKKQIQIHDDRFIYTFEHYNYDIRSFSNILRLIYCALKEEITIKNEYTFIFNFYACTHINSQSKYSFDICYNLSYFSQEDLQMLNYIIAHYNYIKLIDLRKQKFRALNKNKNKNKNK